MADIITQQDTFEATNFRLPADYWESGINPSGSVPIMQPTEPALTTMDLIRAGVHNTVSMCPYSLSDLDDEIKCMRIRNCVLQQADSIASLQAHTGGRKVTPTKGAVTAEYACEIINGTGDVANVVRGEAKPVLCYYSDTGEAAGVWTPIAGEAEDLMLRIAFRLGVAACNETRFLRLLRATAPKIRADVNPRLFPLADGVVEIINGSRDFTPYVADDGRPNPDYVDRYGKSACIIGKNRARNAPGMAEPVFTCPDGFQWSPLQHLNDAVDDPDAAVPILLQSLLFGMRGMSGGYGFWLMDGTRNADGGGGKSTACYIMEAAIGYDHVAHVNMDQLAEKEFYLPQIVGSRMILGEETSAENKAIQETSTIKALMRCAPITINQKHRATYDYTFTGIWYQCMNTDSPKFVSKSGSLYRALIPIYFRHKFAKVKARKAIVDEYSKTQEVGDFIANYAIDHYGAIDDYSETAVATLRRKIGDIRSAGSTAFQFLDEYMGDAANDEIPLNYMYTFFAEWCRSNGYFTPDAKNFKSDCLNWASMRGGWTVEKLDQVRRKRTPWHVDRWMSDNAVSGLVSVEAYGNVRILDRLMSVRTRDWLIRLPDGPDAPEPEQAGRMIEYMQYRAAIVMCAAAAGAADPMAAAMALDAWDRCGRLSPVYHMDGHIAFRFGEEPTCITYEQHQRAVSSGRTESALDFRGACLGVQYGIR